MRQTIYLKRLNRLREKLPQIGAQGLLVSSSHNRRWLSGFEGSSGWLLVTGDVAILGTDFRYWEQALSQAPDYELYKLGGDTTQNDLIRSAQIQNIALESQHVALKDFHNLQQIEEVNWILSENLVEALRTIKDVHELKKIRAAAAITDAAMGNVKQLLRVGMSEVSLAWELEKYMREAGATGLTFQVIVASGPNSALPHHAPGNRLIQDGDILLVDMGASVDGYGSDLSRTFFVSSKGDPLFDERFGLVLRAHDKAIDSMKPGMRGCEVDAVARDIIAAAGYGENFGHGLGHGLGLEGHEGPRLSTSKAETPLASGMVTTVEPGVYIPGWGGIRIEDLVLVTENGVELLSHSPIEPLLAPT